MHRNVVTGKLKEINRMQFANDAFYYNTIDIWNAIKNKTSYSLNNVTDLYTQAVIYYFIWLEFNVEVPHNDFSDWFTNTDEIVIMLNKLGVIV